MTACFSKSIGDLAEICAYLSQVFGISISEIF